MSGLLGRIQKRAGNLAMLIKLAAKVAPKHDFAKLKSLMGEQKNLQPYLFRYLQNAKANTSPFDLPPAQSSIFNWIKSLDPKLADYIRAKRKAIKALKPDQREAAIKEVLNKVEADLAKLNQQKANTVNPRGQKPAVGTDSNQKPAVGTDSNQKPASGTDSNQKPASGTDSSNTSSSVGGGGGSSGDGGGGGNTDPSRWARLNKLKDWYGRQHGAIRYGVPAAAGFTAFPITSSTLSAIFGPGQLSRLQSGLESGMSEGDWSNLVRVVSKYSENNPYLLRDILVALKHPDFARYVQTEPGAEALLGLLKRLSSGGVPDYRGPVSLVSELIPKRAGFGHANVNSMDRLVESVAAFDSLLDLLVNK